MDVAGVVSDRWPLLAHYLGLTTAEISSIKQSYPRDKNDQTFHMLLEWYNKQQTPPTKQFIVQIIEEKMNDPALAQHVISIIS